MTKDELLKRVKALCSHVEDDVVQDFLDRMDAEYLAEFRPEQIARHIAFASRLDPDHPCLVDISERGEEWEIGIIAYDYFSEFATISGLLSGFGLDIREGSIYTFSEAPAPSPARLQPSAWRRRRTRPGLSRKKIVDLFRVRPMPGFSFGPPEQTEFIRELNQLIRQLDAQRYEEASRHVNRRLVETLGRMRAAVAGLLQPVEIRFDNQLSPDDTIMDIRAADTPAFLYAFANALTMRGLYIRKARLRFADAEVRDRFYVRGRHGQKIDDPADQQALKLAATLIKQFTHFLPAAPDPAKAIEYFDQFLDRLLEGAEDGQALEFLKNRKTLTELARLLGTSDFLWEDFVRLQHANLLPLLESYRRTPLRRSRTELAQDLRKRLASVRGEERRRLALNQFKDQELFRIDMKHLLDQTTTLPDFSLALTDLAELILDQTVRECQRKLSRLYGRPMLPTGSPCPFAVFGMGKFGGRELGYASDIEVLFAYAGAGKTTARRSLENSEYFERLAQEILQWIEAKQEGIFHLDVRLRPHGEKGLLANSLDEIKTYYAPDGLAAPFERQALIKLRWVAGDEGLGRAVEAHRDAFVYSNEPWNLTEALALRRRQIQELVDPGQINIKYSRGGLLDVEYGVQYLQLVHGGEIPLLRTPNTLEALHALEMSGILPPAEVGALREAYLFFRMLIDGLRIVRGHAKDLVLPPRDSDAFIFLARRIGYTAEEWQEGARKLEQDIQRHMAFAREFFTRRFGAP